MNHPVGQFTPPLSLADKYCVVLTGQKLLVSSGQSSWNPIAAVELVGLPIDFGNCQPLGSFEGKAIIAVEVPEEIALTADFRWVSLRSLIMSGELQGPAFNLVSTALQLQSWQRDHQFCSRCGQPTQVHHTERAMTCSRCEIHYYPRLSPCIITVISRGDQCLLAQNQKHRPGFYSALAGFIEPGESVEQALHREVMEEVGIEVANLRYFGSQPWPFPGQLMIGFHAEYSGGEIRVDGEEITDAQWWHFRELPSTPPPTTLSGQLIQAFAQRCEQG